MNRLFSRMFCITLLLLFLMPLAKAEAAGFSITGNMTMGREYHTATLLSNGKVLITGGEDRGDGGILNSAEIYDPATGTFSATGNMSTERKNHKAILLSNGKVLITGEANDGIPNSAEIYDPATGTFSATGSMTTERREHYTVTLLPNGKVLITGGYNHSNYLSSAELYDPATGTFNLTGSMNTSRTHHTATLLSNGKVLITGGYDYPSSLSSAELYDSATGTFSATGNMTTERYDHTATLLSNGKVLIIGGGYDDSAELYDPVTGTFSATGSMTMGRDYHAVTLLHDGKVLITGGCGGKYSSPLSSAELYDPVTGTFSATGNMTAERNNYDYSGNNYTATLLLNGKVLITGGYDDYNSLSTAELYDPATASFSVTGNMTTERYGHTATLLSNGKVLITGGDYDDRAKLYDPATGTFSVTGNMTTERYGHTATLLSNGKVLITGGEYQSSAELYDPATGTFSPTGSMTTERYGHTATLLSNGKVLITGDAYDGSAEIYDPATGTFSATGNMTTERSDHTATLLPNGKVLIIGGYDENSAEIYDPVTGTFSATGGMFTERNEHAATLLTNGKVLITGGWGYGWRHSAEIYDPVTGIFSLAGNMTVERYGHTATLLSSGKVLITGGAWRYDNYSAEIYDPAPLPTISGVPATAAPLGIVYGFAPITTNDSSFSISGSLPPGIVFNSATGALSGTPTTAGVYGNIIITVANANGSASLPTFSIIVGQPRIISGNIKHTNEAAIAGVTFSGALCSSTDVSGNYSCIVSSGWSGTITPVMGGYALIPESQSYTNVSSDQTGQNYIAFIIRGFESSGWSTTQVSGTEGAWVMVGSGNYLSGVLPHGGARMAEFNSHNAASGSQTRLYLNNSILVSGDSVLKFWMYHDTGYPSSNDRVQVQVSTDGVVWTNVGSAVSRYTGEIGWSQVTVDLGAYIGRGIYIGFLGISASGNNIYIDDVTIPEKFGFSLTGNMTTGRGYHTAIALSNGMVLITGGGGYSAELYNPATGTFSSTGSMAVARSFHTATLLSNGKALITGGYDSNSAELYNPATGTFSATGSMAVARSFHTATLLSNGKVLIAGGYNGSVSLSSVELYDPATGTFRVTGGMTTERSGHTATLLSNGKVLIAGGSGDNSVELYDPASGTFSVTGSMSTARYHHTATLLSNNKVLITGGYDDSNILSSAELYDPTTETFSATGSMTTPRDSHTATLLPNGKVLITGGYVYNSSIDDYNILKSAEIYDPFNGTFSAIGSMTTARYYHTATLLSNGKVLITGGYDDNDYSLSSAELYDPAPHPTISGTPDTTAIVDVSYGFTPASTNADSFTISGNLPPGITFNSSTGVLSGTPTTIGVYNNIIITAVNANGSALLPAFSITVVASDRQLTVTLAGTGGGNVNSVTAGISFSCASGLSCPAKQLPYNTIITLAATPNTTSLFSGWSGACTNTSGNCEITLNADKSVTATFTAMPFLKIPGTSARYYSAFAAALADTVAMPDNSSVTLYGQATTITGGLILNRPVNISFAGGFDAGFQSNTGGLVTVVTGGVKISKGALRVKNLVVR